MFGRLFRRAKVLLSADNSPKEEDLLLKFEKQELLDFHQSNKTISKYLIGEKPAMISRFGSVELGYLVNYLQRRNEPKRWDGHFRNEITHYAGFFPTKDDYLDRFCKLYFDCLSEINVMGIWYKPGEKYVVRKFMKQADLIPLEAIEPYYHTDPWSKILKGKKVLVVHPFAESILKQYEKRDLLFSDPLVLPKFDLVTIKAVQTINEHDSRFIDWFEALDFMKKQISAVDFDVAIIGAGAYGLPLAAFVKSIGKHAVHLGGATQILFGVKGNRWEELDFFKKLFNEHWERPSEDEKPKGELLEGACYW